MKNIVMIVDLQFGSTGKGQIAGTLGRKWEPDTVVCANGPNAGHTYVWADTFDDTGDVSCRKIVHTVMPIGAVLPSVRNILIGPGAVIDFAKLREEALQSADLLLGKRLIIHPNAAVVTQDHRDRERTLVGISSTMKGNAEAVIEKMRRFPGANIARHYTLQLEGHCSRQGSERFTVIVDRDEYDAAIDSSTKLLVEGAQGSSLSIHSGFYPHVTSRDVSINQVWADCHLPALSQNFANRNDGYDVNIVGVARTYPIRVANRFDETGNMIGYSGDCYPDQKEIRWSDIGREPELTTVTKLPRRLFTFSTEQILEAVRYNAPTSIALTFCDYLPSHNIFHPAAVDKNLEVQIHPVDSNEKLSPCVLSLIMRLEAAASCDVNFLSFGPRDVDVYSVSTYESPARLAAELWCPWEN